MSDIIDTTARGIGTVTAEIKFLHKQANQFLISSAIEIGRRLVEAKSMLSHGEWGPWLEKEVEYSQSQANDLMRIYREYGTGQESFFGNSQAIANLPYTKALRLLALPAEERGEFVEKNDVDAMSTRQLEKALEELKEAKNREERAVKEADAAAEAVLKMEQEMKAASGQSEMLRLKAETAEDKAEKAEKNAVHLREQLSKAQKDLASALNAAKNPTISDDQMAKIRSEAEAQAAMEAEAKAKKAVENAEKKAKQAQQEAEAARTALEKARAAQKTSDGNVAVFKVIFDQTQQDFNRLSGALKKVEEASPETAAKLKAAIGAMLDKMGREMGV